MIVRTGFVSNSSSASFILSKDVYPTIWDLTIAMLIVRNMHNDEKFGADSPLRDRDDQELSRAVLRKQEGEHSEAITFPSCNFETYIWDAGDSWWVSTCNNHPFWKLFTDAEAMTATATPSPYIDYEVRDFIEFQLEHIADFEEV